MRQPRRHPYGNITLTIAPKGLIQSSSSFMVSSLRHHQLSLHELEIAAHQNDYYPYET